MLLDGILQHMVEKEVTEIDAILKDLSNTLVLTGTQFGNLISNSLDKIIPFLKHGVEKELIKTEEESTLFRSNSLCAAFMSMHMRNVGAGRVLFEYTLIFRILGRADRTSHRTSRK